MIQLTTMKNQLFFLNSSLICRIDTTPDTIITLVDGKTLMVKESSKEVSIKFLEYQQQVFNVQTSIVK